MFDSSVKSGKAGSNKLMGGRSQIWQARSLGAGKLFIVIDGWMPSPQKQQSQ